MGIYEKKNLKVKTGLNKLFNKEPKENYAIALERYLAIYEADFNKADKHVISIIDQKYGKNVKSKEKKDIQLYLLRKYWGVLFEDGEVSHLEETQASILKDLLSLSDEDEEAIRNSLVTSIIKPFLDTIRTSNRYSFEDEKKLKEFERKLKCTINITDSDTLSKYRKLWLIENGKLPVIADTDINLQKNEIIHFKQKIDWWETRSKTTQVNYSGVRFGFTPIKGITFKSESYAPRRTTTQEYQVIDTGTLYLTNKRFVFVGSKNGKSIPLSKVVSFTPFSDGIQITKDAGKSPVFRLYSEDGDELSLLLDTLLR